MKDERRKTIEKLIKVAEKQGGDNNTATSIQVIDVIESSGLEPDTTRSLKEKFLPFWEQVVSWKEKAEMLVVTDESQTAEMKMARTARLALRQVRIDADKTRKALKEDSIRYGKAVQGVYNVIDYLVRPIEEHLLKQEQFIEIRQQEARARINEEREAIAAPLSGFIDYTALPPTNAPWADITEEQFRATLDNARKRKKAHEAEQARLEAERIAKEKEDKRIRQENAKLKAEAEQRERQAQEERRKLEEQARKEREEAARALAAERAERERLEKEAKAKQEEERKAKEAYEEARRKARAAPDKEKLLAFASELEGYAFPDLETKEAQSLIGNAKQSFSNLAKYIREQAEKI